MNDKPTCKICGCFIYAMKDKQNMDYWLHEHDSVFMHSARRF